MSSLVVHDGATITKDPADILVKHFDWDAENLAAGVIIANASITVAAVSGDTSTTPLTRDQVTFLPGSRKVQFRISAGAAGSLWRVTNQIVTNESPAQTKERSVYVSVVER
jgi:hypothetical protein